MRGEPGATSPEPTFPLDGLVTADQVARYMNMSRDWVYANRQKLGGAKFGGAVRFDAMKVRRYVDEQTRPKPVVERADSRGRRVHDFEMLERVA